MKYAAIMFLACIAGCQANTDWAKVRSALVTADGVAHDYATLLAEDDEELAGKINESRVILAGVINIIDSGDPTSAMVEAAYNAAYTLVMAEIDEPNKIKRARRVFFGVKAALRLAGIQFTIQRE